MPLFTRKPAQVEARCWDGTPEDGRALVAWIRRHGGQARYHHHDEVPVLRVITIHGPDEVWAAVPTDWIIRDDRGFRPCEPAVFAASYDTAPA